MAPLASSNSDMCVARALVELRELRPPNRAIGWRMFPRARRNDSPITGARLAALARSVAFKNGPNTMARSLRSLREGGFTALYHATRDLELVDRVGRWGRIPFLPTFGGGGGGVIRRCLDWGIDGLEGSYATPRAKTAGDTARPITPQLRRAAGRSEIKITSRAQPCADFIKAWRLILVTV